MSSSACSIMSRSPRACTPQSKRICRCESAPAQSGTGRDKRKQSPNPIRYMRMRIVLAANAAELVVLVVAISIPPMDEAEIHRCSLAATRQAVLNTTINVSRHRHSCFYFLVVLAHACEPFVARIVFAQTLLNRVPNLSFMAEDYSCTTAISKPWRVLIIRIKVNVHLLNEFSDNLEFQATIGADTVHFMKRKWRNIAFIQAECFRVTFGEGV